MALSRAQKTIGVLRILVGWVFLWAFLDKTFGLGFATAKENAWILGNSPTTGYLLHATKGPFAGFFQSLAGNPIVDWLVMLGFLGVGVALILGVGVRIAGYSGAAMMILFYLAGAILPEHNPIVDDHIIYAVLLLLFAFMKSGDWLGFGKRWSSTDLVKKYPILK